MKEIGSFLFFYAGMNGFGAGLSDMTPLICAWEWFPHRKGFVSGLLVAAWGFSSFIFSFVSTDLVNPHDARPTVYDKANDVTYFGKGVADRVPYMLRTLVLIWAFFVIASLLLLRRRDREESD